jgi:GNAT superfamily N-acetyltransferase
MAAAYAGNPWTTWLTDSDPDAEARIMRPYFAELARLSMEVGTADVLADSSGLIAAAVWMDEDVVMPGPPDEPEPWLRELCGRHTARFHALDRVLHEAQRELSQPHQQLMFLVVHPGVQRRGIGSLLLDVRHQQLDARGVSAYLDASSSGAFALYLRHGYRSEGPPVNLPDGGPPVYPMWRPPAPGKG